MEVNTNLKELRDELKLSQQEVAVMLDVTRMTYSKWEKNPSNMPLGKILEANEKLNKLKELKNGVDTSSTN